MGPRMAKRRIAGIKVATVNRRPAQSGCGKGKRKAGRVRARAAVLRVAHHGLPPSYEFLLAGALLLRPCLRCGRLPPQWRPRRNRLLLLAPVGEFAGILQ